MKTATVADLRNNFRRVAAWVEHGETVQILKRGRPFAQLSPTLADPSQSTKPDIMGQLREVWGDRMFSMKEVESMRELELARGI